MENTKKNCSVELRAGEKGLAEVKIQKGVFQGDALSLLLFEITIRLFNNILRKCTGGYKRHKLQENVNHDNINQFAKNEK